MKEEKEERHTERKNVTRQAEPVPEKSGSMPAHNRCEQF